MNALLLILLLITFLAVLLAVRGSKKTTQVLENDFSAAESLLEPHELALLEALERSVPASCRIFTKLRLSDVVVPAEKLSQKIQHAARRHADQFSLTFTLCTQPEMKVIAVVECEGESGSAEDNSFVHKVLAANGIPVASFKAKSEYYLLEVWVKLSEACPGLFEQPSKPAQKVAEPSQAVQTASATPEPLAMETTPAQSAGAPRPEPPPAAAPASPPAGTKPCTACSGIMVRRQVMKGPHTGKLFLVCSNYPTCRQMVALTDAAVQPVEPVTQSVSTVASAPSLPTTPPSADTTPAGAATKAAAAVSTYAPATETPGPPPAIEPPPPLSSSVTTGIPDQPVTTTRPILLTATVTAQPVSAMPTALPTLEPQHDQTCPKCGKDLVKMQVAKGAHAGKYFWACSDYPTCRHMAAIKN